MSHKYSHKVSNAEGFSNEVSKASDYSSSCLSGAYNRTRDDKKKQQDHSSNTSDPSNSSDATFDFSQLCEDKPKHNKNSKYNKGKNHHKSNHKDHDLSREEFNALAKDISVDCSATDNFVLEKDNRNHFSELARDLTVNCDAKEDLKSVQEDTFSEIAKDLSISCNKPQFKTCSKDVCENKEESDDSSSKSSKSKSSKSKSSKSKKHTGKSLEKRFVVTVGPKTGHQWADYNDDKESFYINGKNGPVLHLYRNYTYYFCFDKSLPDKESNNTRFILTDNPAGGRGSMTVPGGFSPINQGCVSFKVTKDTPRYFYYQSSKSRFMGGLIIVHDK